MKLTRDRYLALFIKETIPDKMAFVGGPRQVGKTTMCQHLGRELSQQEHPFVYLNWDIVTDRKALLAGELPTSQLYILDEIHKNPKWRNLVKGFYDGARKKRSFIVTGSARLDYYRRGGDSLQGRYRYFRLHPYSLAELGATKANLDALLRFGGFPEPLAKQTERAWRLWQRDRVERVIYDDLRDLETVKEIALLEELALVLPSKISSILSLKSLKEDLQVSHGAVERWISILERLYFCFRIPPYGSPRIRAVKKEQKLYFWDWSSAEQPGPRFENLVASQLLKYCHFIEDTEGHRMELRFLRDIDKREVDFVVLQDKKPIFAVECKSGESRVANNVKYFKARTPIPKFYQVHLGNRDYFDKEDGIRVMPFVKFCKELRMP